jgi:hypothetical protein
VLTTILRIVRTLDSTDVNLQDKGGSHSAMSPSTSTTSSRILRKFSSRWFLGIVFLVALIAPLPIIMSRNLVRSRRENNTSHASGPLNAGGSTSHDPTADAENSQEEDSMLYIGKIPPSILREKWQQMQENGRAGPRISVFRASGIQLVSSVNSLLSGALFAIMNSRRFVFDSRFNEIFSARDMGWDFDDSVLESLSDPSKSREIHETDRCKDPDSPLSKIMSESDLAHASDPWHTQHAPAISVDTSCPMYRYWANNEHVKPKLVEWGLLDPGSVLPSGFQVAHHLTSLLLQPRGELRNIVQKTFRPAQDRDHAIIGIEARGVGDKADLAQHFFTCATKLAEEVKNGRQVKYYISTDSREVQDRAAEFFGADSIIRMEASSKPRTSAGKLAMYQSAVDSVYMGMHSDGLVVTARSAAGMLAAISSGKIPYQVDLQAGPNQYLCVKTDVTQSARKDESAGTSDKPDKANAPPQTPSADTQGQTDKSQTDTSAAVGTAEETLFQAPGAVPQRFVGRFSPLWPGPNQRLQDKWHASQKRGNQAHKYAKFLGAGGFANTMNALIGGALYALVSDRRFLFHSHFNELFNAQRDGWHFEVATIPEELRRTSRHFDLLDDTCFPEDAEWSRKLSSQQGIQPAAWASLAVVSVTTNCPLQKYWGRNPSLQQHLIDLGLIDHNSDLPQGFQIAHQLVRFLLQPCPQLESKVREVFETGNMSSYAIVGVQVRMGGAPIGDTVLFGPADTDWSHHFITCAQQAAKQLSDPRPVKYYISADRASVMDKARDILGPDSVMSGLGPVQHTTHQSKATDSLHRAALDSLYMGMYASAVVLTPGSTFGSLAAVASGRNPYHVIVEEGPDQFKCVKTDLRNPPHRYHLPGSSTVR